ncbi:lipoyl domain-containing protein [Halosolutus amylolyticus]|uniref:Lipoyl domain-containing protein n=1 Tax=Halosolutus amylolyticus TaxID=2932267 RepID=A0ABD5PX79_9EURY|nr:lipoyl domain-containing protein [Halosolutus amylolyticus]
MSGTEDRVPIEAADVWPDDVEEEEGIVVNWFAREGRQVDEGETLCEIQVEKVSVDVPAPVAGEVVEIARDEDEEFTRADTLGWIDAA